MLNEARQEIKDKADKVDLEGKADKVDLASKANKTELATKVDKTEFSDLKNQTSKNSDDVSKNSDALSSLQSKVNGLSISLCDCYDEASERDVQDCHYTGTCARLGCSRDGYVMVDQLLRQEQIHATPGTTFYAFSHFRDFQNKITCCRPCLKGEDVSPQVRLTV